MIIEFSPVVSTRRITGLNVEGDALTIQWDGGDQTADFKVVGEGDMLPKAAVSHKGDQAWWLASNVTRLAGEIVLTVYLPQATNADKAAQYPKPFVGTGDVPLPDCDGAATAGPPLTPRTIPDPQDRSIL